jgi:hypothetical protein
MGFSSSGFCSALPAYNQPCMAEQTSRAPALTLQVIDTVLLPFYTTIYSAFQRIPSLSGLLAVVNREGLQATLNDIDLEWTGTSPGPGRWFTRTALHGPRALSYGQAHDPGARVPPPPQFSRPRTPPSPTPSPTSTTPAKP